jgi:RNA-directed DNA polymerase
VLAHKGARTPGRDGRTKDDLASEEAKRTLLRDIAPELRERSVRPSPGRRVQSPQRPGTSRPRGLATRTERVGQMRRKMVLDPSWESDCLHGSSGGRPGRRTRDGLALLDSDIKERTKYFWGRAGAIRAAFASIPQGTWLPLRAERGADGRLLERSDGCLNAGMMHGQRLHRPDSGTPPGASCSPLWSHVDWHQRDRYWGRHDGGRHRKATERRRQAHQGPGALRRYAEDGRRRTTGGTAAADRVRDEGQTVLAAARKRARAVEQTHVTPVHAGFDFLGCHGQRSGRGHDRPNRLVTPSAKAGQRLKAKGTERPESRRLRAAPVWQFRALNAVRRGGSTD